MFLCGQHCNFHTSGGGSAAALFQSSELGAPLKGGEEEAPYKRTREVQSPPPSSDSDLPIARRRWFSSVRFVPNPRGGRLARAKGRNGKKKSVHGGRRKKKGGPPPSLNSVGVRPTAGIGVRRRPRCPTTGLSALEVRLDFMAFFSGGKKPQSLVESAAGQASLD